MHPTRFEFIKEHNTLVPNGYNIRERRRINHYATRNKYEKKWVIGSIITPNYSKVDNVKITSWSFIKGT